MNRQNLESQTVSENSETSRVAIAAKTCEQKGSLITLFVHNYIISVPSSSLPITVVAAHTPSDGCAAALSVLRRLKWRSESLRWFKR